MNARIDRFKRLKILKQEERGGNIKEENIKEGWDYRMLEFLFKNVHGGKVSRRKRSSVFFQRCFAIIDTYFCLGDNPENIRHDGQGSDGYVAAQDVCGS